MPVLPHHTAFQVLDCGFQLGRRRLGQNEPCPASDRKLVPARRAAIIWKRAGCDLGCNNRRARAEHICAQKMIVADGPQEQKPHFDNFFIGASSASIANIADSGLPLSFKTDWINKSTVKLTNCSNISQAPWPQSEPHSSGLKLSLIGFPLAFRTRRDRRNSQV